MISNESIEQLKSRLDIIDVVSSYIELRKSGANFKAPCPFHDEKSPSFVVSPSKQIYHCFGCGASGDSISFVMDYEKLNYPEAIEKLASQYNFSLQYTQASKQKKHSKLLQKLSEYYQTLLTHNNQALTYLQERGIFESSIEKFELGYAPSSNQTIEFIQKNMFSTAEAVELGAIGQQDTRLYARFIERIIFPIYSVSAHLVGFGGRTISGHQAKYVNSPQTKIFNKSRLLYAYHLAKQSIYAKKEIIIVEGYMDVIMLHQAGFTQAVATLGTALTSEHLPLIRKSDAKVILAYDGDNAGINAAIKASKMLSASGIDGGVVIFKDGLDPADMVHHGKSQELVTLFRHAHPLIEFVIDTIILHYDLKNPKDKERALQEVLSYLKTLSPLLQEEYQIYTASKFGLNPAFVKIAKSGNMNKTDFKSSYKDIWELSIIKTILVHPEFLNQIIEVIDPGQFRFHAQELALAIKGEVKSSILMAVLVDDEIIPFENYEELKKELATFLINYYNKEFNKVQLQQDISFEQKAFKIRKIRDKIAILKKGESNKEN